MAVRRYHPDEKKKTMLKHGAIREKIQ